jgi:hypothetical protein
MSADRERRPWYRPTAADLAFVVLALIIFQSCRGRLLSDPGLGWHLRNIDAMIAQKGWLTADPFSGPRGGQPWWTNQWLGELPLWLGEKWAGLEGIAAAATLILAFTFRCLYRMLERDGLPRPAAAFWTLAAAAGTSCSWVARPNLFTLLFTLLTARACEAYHAGRRPGKAMLWLLPLFAIWANTHGGFVAGLVLLGASCAIECGLAFFATNSSDRVDARRKARGFTAILAGCFAATLVNPYGPTLYSRVFQLLGNPYFMSLHPEWRSPQFHGAGAFQFEGLMLLFPLLLAVSDRRPNAIELALSLLLFHFALTGLRYLPLWVLVVTPLLARSAAKVPALEALTRRLKQSPQAGELFATNPGPAPWLWSAAAAIVLVMASRPIEGKVARLLPEIIPTPALDRLIALHARTPEAVVFHSYNWGGYLTWHGWRPDGHGLQTWIDDRNEVQGQGHVEEYFSILNAEPGWNGRLATAGVSIVCIPPETPLACTLADSPDWREVDRDSYAATFVRSQAITSNGPGDGGRGSQKQ